jgi:hypothetical protein
LEDLEIHGHRLPPFLPPGGGIARLPQLDSCDGRRKRHIGKRRSGGENQHEHASIGATTIDDIIAIGTSTNFNRRFTRYITATIMPASGYSAEFHNFLFI